ncbi:ATP-dependent DNA helicase RecG [Halorhodospira halochloris]|uniref:ATP-dependent DNA helicase RecG n=1 Tax=Halorhodospira halochloris TaxID=1052 RepID=UPI003084045E
MIAPDWRLQALPGVGERSVQRLHRLNIYTLADLLLHLPIRYEDRTRLRRIADLSAGERALVEGAIAWSEVAQGRRRRLLCRISDGSGQLDLVFFNYPPKTAERLQRGLWLRCFGEVRAGYGSLQMVHPEYKRVKPGDTDRLSEALTPVYRSTDGLHQKKLRSLVDVALELFAQHGQDHLDGSMLPESGWPGLLEAFQQIHRPSPETDTQALLEGRHPAVQRVAYEELLAHHLTLRRYRLNLHAAATAPVLDGGEGLAGQLRDTLPFELTAAQLRVDSEVAADMAQPSPMLRLLQGDVGSGKTVIAALACARAIGSGYQAAVMAPTELLAEQHWRTLSSWLIPLEVELAWLSGSASTAQRRSAMQSLAAGRAGVAIGTHALFQEAVEFFRLGLVVIDEQHRFGVNQRLALKEKAGSVEPHQLSMTATPIPRTLAMTTYADLDVSLLDERPPGRGEVKTVAVSSARRDEVIERIRGALLEGRQAYWVCTLVEASEELDAQAAEETAEELARELDECTIGLIHGRMAAAEKERAMAQFAAGEIDLLVATTVIEVGVDVANASLMIIDNAERLGLAQLHQLRGRVGRGSSASSCVLMYHGPLSAVSRQRLEVMRETTDGFVIAERDLQIRGPGEFLGSRQTGDLGLKVADLSRDKALLDTVQRVAGRLLTEQPDVVEALIERWIGEAKRYGQV